MEWKRIILWISIFIILVTFYRITLNKWPRNGLEGMEDKSSGWSTDSSEYNGIDCSNSYADSNTLPLREYFVKSSFNSAHNGVGFDVSTNTLGQRISEGYRFLDLNVYCASGENLYVGFAKDNNPTMNNTNLPFEMAIQYIQQNAFSKKSLLPASVPSLIENYSSYPLFVHIRVYRAPDSKVDVISKVAKVLNALNYPQFLRDENDKPIQINGCTPLNKLMGKMIFTLDILNITQIYAPTATPGADYVPAETIESIRSFVNMLTGGNTCLAFYDYNDAQIVSKTKKLRNVSNLKTNAQYMFIAFPNPINAANPDSYKFVLDNSIQFIPMRAYLSDSASKCLANYIKVFDDLKKPFVPLNYVYTTINNGALS